ncbi:MAG TPA: 50S ribosomal protein L5 [bacterium]|nr:50S ribosomal protein L5 [bacterium]
MNRLNKKYIEYVSKEAKKDIGVDNVMDVPRILKIKVNSGIGPFMDNREAVESFAEELSNICSQKPYMRKARVSEAGFKIKKGDIVGFSATLRGDRMWAFLDKLINVALPRVRDFRGLEDNSFDDNGNYSLGIREHVIFPEVNPNTTKGIRGVQLTIVFNTKDKDKNRKVLQYLGFPFRKDDKE